MWTTDPMTQNEVCSVLRLFHFCFSIPVLTFTFLLLPLMEVVIQCIIHPMHSLVE
uniref:Uncharacterized protein n=1 Tax=Picea glauca TaxID=3330 RepID=A0A101LUZ6_PICGL|nr:hypothetical protein ABT39_MTgene2179 [Picea glauca]